MWRAPPRRAQERTTSSMPTCLPLLPLLVLFECARRPMVPKLYESSSSKISSVASVARDGGRHGVVASSSKPCLYDAHRRGPTAAPSAPPATPQSSCSALASVILARASHVTPAGGFMRTPPWIALPRLTVA